MNGVEILAINEVVVEAMFNWKTFWIVLGCIFGLFIFVGFIIGTIDGMYSTNIKISVILGIIFGILIGTLAGFGYETPVAYENRYKVIISDEVQMNCFLEKYEIVDQEGKIYTVRERK